MSEATLKVTLCDETRRVRLAAPASFAAFEQYLLKLFPNLGAMLAQAHTVRLQIFVRSSSLAGTGAAAEASAAGACVVADRIVDSFDALHALWTGAPDCRILLNLRLASHASAPADVVAAAAAAEPMKRNKVIN